MKTISIATTMDTNGYLKFPVRVAFSKVGNERQKFAFDQLLKSNNYWSARYDDFTGEIILTAKKDLGFLRLTEDFKMERMFNIDKTIIKADNGCAPVKIKKSLEKTEEANVSEGEVASNIDGKMAIDEYARQSIASEIVCLETMKLISTESGSPIEIRPNGKADTFLRTIHYNISMPKYEADESANTGGR